MSLDLHQVVHTVPLYTTLAQTTLLFIGRPSATKRKSQDSVGTEGESVTLTTDGLRHFNMLCQLVYESCCSATHSTSKHLPTQDSVHHFGHVAKLKQPDSRVREIKQRALQQTGTLDILH